MNPGVHVAIQAAIEEQRRRDAEEEQDMTNYTREELDSEWEFKIVRSGSGAFRKPDVLAALLEEEAQAGWEMVEKFDDQRVRFKRLGSARKRDDFLPEYIDPYRTVYDRGADGKRKLAILLGFSSLLLGIIVFIFFSGGSEIFSTETPWIVLAIIASLLILVVARTRR